MPVLQTHNRIASSSDTKASREPSEEDVTNPTKSKWPSRTAMQWPVLPSHSHTVVSLGAEASLEPSAVNQPEGNALRV